MVSAETGSAKPARKADSFGVIEVPADRYWGAQTQRSLENFRIGGERMPEPLIHALGLVKRAAARGQRRRSAVSTRLGAGDRRRGRTKSLAGQLDAHFPLVVWQTGSGTQTNMNVNEVIANRANELLGGAVGGKSPIHPNDHVNMGQSSNDMLSRPPCISPRSRRSTDRLLPALDALRARARREGRRHSPTIVKIGRTHLQDATPLTLGQEFSGYARADRARDRAHREAVARLYPLAPGRHRRRHRAQHAKPDSPRLCRRGSRRLTGLPFVTAANKFEALAAHDALVSLSRRPDQSLADSA